MPPDQGVKADFRTYLVAFLTIVLWASAFAGVRAGLVSYTPENIALLRYLTASIVLVIYAVLIKMPLPHRQDLPGLFGTGLAGFTIYNLALNYGEQRIEAGTASLLVAAAPVFVALLAGIFFGERLRLWAWLGILLSFVGVAIISIKPAGGLQLSLYALFVLLAALSIASYTVGQKPFLKRYTPLQFVTYSIWSGTVFLLIFTPGLIRQMQTARLSASLAVVYMGIFPGVIGYIGWSYVLARLPAGRAGSFMYVTPLAATLIAWLWLGELPGISALIGGSFIIAGVVVVNVLGRRSSAAAAPGESSATSPAGTSEEQAGRAES
ncbi:MAG: EamA family transporter [Anaerolineaceae bacterium]|nr:EamA family transporter [Anaerolineaceae bacterium]